MEGYMVDKKSSEEQNDDMYYVVLFYSISGALFAEKLLKQGGVEYKLIPVPRHLSSDCGVCVRFRSQNGSKVKTILEGKVEIQSICPL
jgi:hypothetical protein